MSKFLSRFYIKKFQYVVQSSYSFHKSASLEARGRVNAHAGMRQRLKVMEDEQTAKEDDLLEEDEELDQYESDFSNVHEFYDQYKSDVHKAKVKTQQKITIQKFFKPPKQPAMLTWNERQQIKYLYESNPEEWDIRALAESFPASPDIIKKVLKVKYTRESEASIKRLDEKVAENWKLLEEGKLEADPRLIKHLQKFVGRRNEIISMQPNDFAKYLAEKKEEPNWNNGQMRSILEGYENAILDIQQKHQQKLFPNENQQKLLPDIKSVVKERIKFDVETKQPTDDFLIGNEKVQNSSKQFTLKSFQKNIIKKLDKDNTVPSIQEVIVEDQIKVSKKNRVVPNTKINQKLSRLAGYQITKELESEHNKDEWKEPQDDEWEQQGDKDTLEQSQKHVKYSEFQNNYKMQEIENKSSTETNNTDKELVNHTEFQQTCEPVETKTEIFAENSEIDQVAIKATELKQREMKTKTKDETPKKATEYQQSYEPIEIKNNSNLTENAKIFIEAEEKSIENTFFWKSDEIKSVNNSNTKLETKNNKKSKIEINPDFIKIPKSQKGSGLTFKVNDCYYDDDGEFLYKVPGMTK